MDYIIEKNCGRGLNFCAKILKYVKKGILTFISLYDIIFYVKARLALFLRFLGKKNFLEEIIS